MNPIDTYIHTTHILHILHIQHTFHSQLCSGDTFLKRAFNFTFIFGLSFVDGQTMVETLVEDLYLRANNGFCSVDVPIDWYILIADSTSKFCKFIFFHVFVFQVFGKLPLKVSNSITHFNICRITIGY